MKFNLLTKKKDENIDLVRTKFNEYRPGQNKICFTAFVSANIFEIIILARNHYGADDYKVLLLSDWNCGDDYKRIKDINYSTFDEVILIRERGTMTQDERFLKIRHQLKQIDFRNMDVIHLFAFNQQSFMLKLINFIAPKTKLIQNQYTGASYFVKEYYKGLSEIFYKDKYTILRLVNRIDELWVHDKDLIIGDINGIKIKEMRFDRIYSKKETLKKLCENLNEFYGYTHNPIEHRIIFLEQPLYKFFKNDIESEMLAFEEIFNVLKPFNIIVKTHPRCDNKKYKDFEVDLFESPKIPWELILLNELLGDNLEGKIFITYFSDSLNTGHIMLGMLGINHYSIRTVDILKQRVEISIGSEWLDRYQERFYSKYNKNIYNVKDTRELETLMINITDETKKNKEKHIMRDKSTPYIIGETAYTHEGDMNYMLKLIDQIYNLGLTAVKFHVLLDIDSYFHKGHDLTGIIKKCMFNKSEWRKIFNYGIRKQLDIIALCDDVESVEFILEEYPNIIGIELHATSLNEVFMLDRVAMFKNEVLLGIGGSSDEEIVFAIDYLLELDKQDIILMYGFQSYPTKIKDINLKKMLLLHDQFNLPIGYADHTAYDDSNNPIVSSIPFALGINILEKHMILRSGDERLDYESALDTKRMKRVLDSLNNIKDLLTMDVNMSYKEVEYGKVGPMKKAILSNRNIVKGEVLKKEDFKYLRTEAIANIQQRDIARLIGKMANEDIDEDSIMDFSLVSDAVIEEDCSTEDEESYLPRGIMIKEDGVDIDTYNMEFDDVFEVELSEDKEIIDMDIDIQGDE